MQEKEMADDVLTALIRDLIGKIERLDERTKTIQSAQDELRKDLKELKDDFYDEIQLVKDKASAALEKTSQDFVKKTEFEPIKRFVYGVVGFILVSVGSVFFTLLK
jgi:predicted  nucleic acid-binding Zn-ribbon protein